MSAALVSCIVPVYNGERYVRGSVGSIMAQTHRPIEVIVADDGSTDGTRHAVEAFGDEIRFVTQPTAGPAATRNLGLQAARGEFLAFLDADDLWHPDKLALQLGRFVEDPELDLCLSHVQMFWTPDVKAEGEAYRDHPRAQPIPGYATTTLLARRYVFETIGGFDTGLWFGDATDWFIRAAEKGLKLEVLPDVLTFHRMHDENLTRRRREDSGEEFLRIVKASLDRRREEGLAPGELPFPGGQAPSQGEP